MACHFINRRKVFFYSEYRNCRLSVSICRVETVRAIYCYINAEKCYLKAVLNRFQIAKMHFYGPKYEVKQSRLLALVFYYLI